MQSKITLIGMFNYDNTVLDNLSFPDGIDRDTAVSTILLRCGEFELLYPNLDFLRALCSVWSKKHYRTFDKWITALNIEYDPLNNYDRHEEYEDSREGSSGEDETQSGQDTVALSGSDSESGSDSKSGTDSTKTNSKTTGSTSPAQTTTTNTQSVSAFDSSGYSPKEQNVSGIVVNTAGSDSSSVSGGTSTTYASGVSHSNTTTYGKTDTTTYGKSIGITRSNEETLSHEAHLWGNIGVTTSQEMLKAELDVARFNLYDQIADIFCEEFCLMIY